MRVERNTEKDGIEIFFDDKPDQALRDRLRGYKFRPTRLGGAWYWWAKYTPERWEFAVSLTGVTTPAPVTPAEVPITVTSADNATPAVSDAIADKVDSAIAYLQKLLEEI
jgi:hypothetical protein